MVRTGSRETCAMFAYPDHHITPEDLLHFIETEEFTEAWGDLGLDDEDDLAALQVGIMASPKGGAVIQGTGGLRKIRFAPSKWNTGRSGAARVCYVYFEDYYIVLLVLVYAKNEKEDLSPRDKAGIRKYIERFEKALERRKTIS